MNCSQDQVNTDVLVVGSGLGATAAAKALSDGGYGVALLPGIGSSRSRDIDGGVVDGTIVEAAFGQGAPLGPAVSGERELVAIPGRRFDVESPVPVQDRMRYRRSELEAWAMERATRSGAVFLEDFIEGRVVPVGDGRIALTSERDARVIHARAIALCEGADPRIALRVQLRPDYGPEDQLHFARVHFQGEPVRQVLRGTWRTGWGMPIEVALIPQVDGTLVSVVTRIENVMRASRSSRDALRDILDSSEFATLGIDGSPGDPGMELVALRENQRGMRFVHDRLLMGIDFSGVLDPRSIDRAALTIDAGRHLAGYLIEHDLGLDEWPNVASRIIHDAVPPPPPYHDDTSTGYLEEGAKGISGKIADRFAGIVRRGQRMRAGTG